ncbi:hypothetical protein [Cohaesibacter intestini]|uniref:hypothetical protein n=1 Tax=Cohaesibacter intestini TaxID=2211145 RepID=UPI000DEBE49A|nr:hypothetical protein [Cohaesibacter intestini]
MKQSVVAAFVVGLVCGIVLWPLALLKAPGAWQIAQQQVCQIVDGGRWVAKPGLCVKADCYLNGTCGQWAALPASVCSSVAQGDNLAKAYFEMGEPVSISDDAYHWRWHAASDEGPIAVVDGERIAAFTCSPPDGLASSQTDGGSLFGNFKLPFSDKRGNIMD